MFDGPVTDIFPISQFRAEMDIDADFNQSNKKPEDGGNSVPMDSQDSSGIQVLLFYLYLSVWFLRKWKQVKLTFFFSITGLLIRIFPLVELNSCLPHILTQFIRLILKTIIS